jgi:hypothetical protein
VSPSLLLAAMFVLTVASVGRADETVQVCGSYANHAFARTSPVPGITVKVSGAVAGHAGVVKMGEDSGVAL